MTSVILFMRYYRQFVFKSSLNFFFFRQHSWQYHQKRCVVVGGLSILTLVIPFDIWYISKQQWWNGNWCRISNLCSICTLLFYTCGWVSLVHVVAIYPSNKANIFNYLVMVELYVAEVDDDCDKIVFIPT